MNVSNQNQTEAIFYTLDEWFAVFASTFDMDVVYVLVLIPLSALSFILNSFTFRVLLSEQFNLSFIYSYFRLYVFNSLIISLLLTTTFVSNSYRYFEFTNTYASITYGIYVFTPILTVLYFYSSLLEIIIIIERTEKFLPPRFRYLKRLDFNTTCFGLFAFSLALNSPTFINWYTASESVQLADGTIKEIFYWGATEFSLSAYGKVLTFEVYFVSDFIFLFIKINLNILSVYKIREYLAKIHSCSPIEMNASSSSVSKKLYITQTDRSLTKMVILVTVLSILENIFFAIANGYYLFEIGVASGYLVLFSYVAMGLKHGSNFFVFYFFNNFFKSEFDKRMNLFFSKNN